MEIGKVYVQKFSNGDEIYVKPIKMNKIGSYQSIIMDNYTKQGKKPLTKNFHYHSSLKLVECFSYPKAMES